MAGETRKLAEFASSISYRSLPREVVERVGVLFADWLASALGGSVEVPGRIAARVARRLGGPPESTVVGYGDRVSCFSASFANGVMSHILELDDVHRRSVTHPGAAVFPAALAVWEATGGGGEKLVEAAVAGYELVARVGEAAGASHYEIWHTTATAGTFGAAAAAGRLLELSSEEMAWALGSAGTSASGLWEFLEEGAMSKHLHAGKAAALGVLSAMLAEEGFTGSTTILEGRRGFLKATSRSPDLSALTDGLGEGYKVMEASIKPHASCRHTHSAIDAALKLRGEFDLGEVTEVKVEVYGDALKIAGNPRPKTPYEAKFSLAYCVAVALLHGKAGVSEFTADKLRSRELRSLMKKVKAEVSSELDRMYPDKFPARVTVYTRSGSYTAQVEYPLGDPENPVSRQQLEGKFRELASRALPPEKAARAFEAALKPWLLSSPRDIISAITPS